MSELPKTENPVFGKGSVI